MKQQTFKRYELKYKLTRAQKEALLEVMQPYMHLDQYGHSTIRNIYYDTDNFRLIRRSLEKPVYKEKLRVRSYKKVNEEEEVFVELKKKYKSVVYKRRITLPENEANDWLMGREECPKNTQVSKEVDYFMDFYEGLHPVVYLSYEREAFYSLLGDDFRVTFDENILFRDTDLSLELDPYGRAILSDDEILMEIKTSGGIPLWMTRFLTENHINKTSFSKYGTAYKMILADAMGGQRYA